MDVGSEVVPNETEPGTSPNGVENRSITPLTSNSYKEETDTPLLGSGCQCMKVNLKVGILAYARQRQH
jgi:hypothetical protein